MVDPDPALAPVTVPVIGPTVQAKELGEVDVNAIFGSVPLQMLNVAALVIIGVGLIVIVIL